jgi:predicted RNA-binding protein associated with RNAse of E/G family
MHLKIQTHNLIAKTHTVKAGTFPVKVYQPHGHGLFFERPFLGHPKYKYLKAHILPELHLQICRFETHQNDYPLEFYIDIVSVERSAHLWTVKDLYLDLGIGWNRQLLLMDTDELFGGVRAGLITLEEAFLASNTLHNLVNQLSEHNNNLNQALAAQGLRLEWNLEAVV